MELSANNTDDISWFPSALAGADNVVGANIKPDRQDSVKIIATIKVLWIDHAQSRNWLNYATSLLALIEKISDLALSWG